MALYKAKPFVDLRATENNFSVAQIVGTSKASPWVIIERDPISYVTIKGQKIEDKYKIKAELKRRTHSYVEMEEHSGVNYFRVLNIKNTPAIFKV